MNTISLVGRLAATPESKQVNDNTVTTFRIATKGFKDHTDWHNIEVWGKQAESSALYLDKGKLAGITGELNVREYEDKDGNKRKAYTVRANRVEFLSPKSEGNESAVNPGAPNLAPQFDDNEPFPGM